MSDPIMTYPEMLAFAFVEWMLIEQEESTKGQRSELPSDGDLPTMIAIWMQDTHANGAATYDAFMRAVVLIVAGAAAGALSYDVNGQHVKVTIPKEPLAWWMLEPTEFEAIKSRNRITR